MRLGGGAKYRAVKTTVEGITFASKKEAARYMELRLLERAGAIDGLVLQPRYELVVNALRVGCYVADFGYVNLPNGEVIIEDCKGFRTPVYRLKKRLVEALYGFRILET